MTRLYLHYKSKAVPLLMLPTAAKLADVAKLSSKHRDWETAVAAAQDVAATDTQAAARLIKKMTWGSCRSMAAASAWLQLPCLYYTQLGSMTALSR